MKSEAFFLLTSCFFNMTKYWTHAQYFEEAIRQDMNHTLKDRILFKVGDSEIAFQ
jgi:TolA-binding protein